MDKEKLITPDSLEIIIDRVLYKSRKAMFPSQSDIERVCKELLDAIKKIKKLETLLEKEIRA